MPPRRGYLGSTLLACRGVAVAYNIHEAPCSMLRLRPQYLLRVQNHHNVPFNNCEQEEALTCMHIKASG